MPSTTTRFDPTRAYLYVDVALVHPVRGRYDFRAIIDTGAPRTEFADAFLVHAGFLESVRQDIPLRQGLQTQKHGKLVLPTLEICGHVLTDYQVMVSRFEESWGIAALIGLDFFRRFRVTVDYKAGHLVTESYA